MDAAPARSAPRYKEIIAAVLIFFAVLILLRFLWYARSIFLVAVLGTLFGLALARGVDYLERWKIKRGIGAPLLVLLLLALLTGLGFLLAPTLKKQATQLREKLPAAVDKVEEWTGVPASTLTSAMQQSQGGGEQQQPEQKSEAPATEPQSKPTNEPQQKPPADPQQATSTATADPEAAKKQEQQPQQQPAEPPASAPQQSADTGAQKQQPQGDSAGGGAAGGEQTKKRLRDTIGQNLDKVGKVLFPFVSATVAIIGGIIFVIFLAMFIAADPGLYRRGLVHLIPPARRARGEEVLAELGDVLRQWLVARLIAMVAVGAITGIGLALLRVPAAAALGAIAALLEFIPFIGPIVAAIPAMGMALVVSPAKAASVALLFLVIQQLEGNVITPLLLKNRLDVPPAVTIISVSAMGMLFGVLGMLIAEPLSAAAIVLTRRLYVDRIEHQV